MLPYERGLFLLALSLRARKERVCRLLPLRLGDKIEQRKQGIRGEFPPEKLLVHNVVEGGRAAAAEPAFEREQQIVGDRRKAERDKDPVSRVHREPERERQKDEYLFIHGLHDRLFEERR